MNQGLRAEQVDLQLPSKLIGPSTDCRNGLHITGVRNQNLDGTELGDGNVGKRSNRFGISQVQRHGQSLATLCANPSSDLFASIDATSTKYYGVTSRGECNSCRLADSRGGSGYYCGSAFGVRGKTRHQCAPVVIGETGSGSGRRLTVLGSDANPRTLTEWTRFVSAGSIS